MDGADQQRVAGWLALTLQHACGLLDGSRVEYGVTERGGIRVSWRGGPTAVEVAEYLLGAADPDMAVICVAEPAGSDGELGSASVEAGGVRVSLCAVDPSDHRRRDRLRDPIGALAVYRPPVLLRDDGYADDVVLWELPPLPGDLGAATVVRVPAVLTEDVHWTTSTTTVVNLRHHFSPTAHPDRVARWQRACDNASVHLRAASQDWSVQDADDWLADTVAPARPRPGHRAAFCTAVTWPDRCVMRLRSGLRVDATVETYAYTYGLTSRIPAVVLSALARLYRPRSPGIIPLDAALPEFVDIAEFGRDDERCRVRLNSSITVPACRG